MATAGMKQVVLVGVDDSKESVYSLEWALSHLLSPPQCGGESPFKVVLVHVKMSAASAVRISGPGVGEFLAVVEKDIKRTANAVVERAKQLCQEKSINDFEVEVCEGDARAGLCDAVDKHHADMLVVGSHGYGPFKRAILGSVSDHCAHHAHCSVVIVKKPKNLNAKQ